MLVGNSKSLTVAVDDQCEDTAETTSRRGRGCLGGKSVSKGKGIRSTCGRKAEKMLIHQYDQRKFLFDEISVRISILQAWIVLIKV